MKTHAWVSHSGESARKIADVLHRHLTDFFPTLLLASTPRQTRATGKWFQEYGSVIEMSRLGIICVTGESLSDPFLVFEAGVLAGAVGPDNVLVLIHGLTLAHLQGPLADLGAAITDPVGTWDFLRAVNGRLPEPIPTNVLRQNFEQKWPTLEAEFEGIPATAHRYETELQSMVQEVLVLVRGLSQTNAAIISSASYPVLEAVSEAGVRRTTLPGLPSTEVLPEWMSQAGHSERRAHSMASNVPPKPKICRSCSGQNPADALRCGLCGQSLE